MYTKYADLDLTPVGEPMYTKYADLGLTLTFHLYCSCSIYYNYLIITPTKNIFLSDIESPPLYMILCELTSLIYSPATLTSDLQHLNTCNVSLLHMHYIHLLSCEKIMHSK